MNSGLHADLPPLLLTFMWKLSINQENCYRSRRVRDTPFTLIVRLVHLLSVT